MFFIFFGLGNIAEVLSYSNSFQVPNETSDLISKKGGGGKKSGSKKKAGKRSGAKKKGGKRMGEKKPGDKKTQTSLNKFKSNNEIMREAAKERYRKWKENKKARQLN